MLYKKQECVDYIDKMTVCGHKKLYRLWKKKKKKKKCIT